MRASISGSPRSSCAAVHSRPIPGPKCILLTRLLRSRRSALRSRAIPRSWAKFHEFSSHHQTVDPNGPNDLRPSTNHEDLEPNDPEPIWPQDEEEDYNDRGPKHIYDHSIASDLQHSTMVFHVKTLMQIGPQIGNGIRHFVCA
jgi:hypothetical protein